LSKKLKKVSHITSGGRLQHLDLSHTGMDDDYQNQLALSGEFTRDAFYSLQSNPFNLILRACSSVSAALYSISAVTVTECMPRASKG
jgi:hypothetical protein